MLDCCYLDIEAVPDSWKYLPFPSVGFEIENWYKLDGRIMDELLLLMFKLRC